MSRSTRDPERALDPTSRAHHAHAHPCAQGRGERRIYARPMRAHAVRSLWPQPRRPGERAAPADHRSVPSLREGLAAGGRRRRIGFGPAREGFGPGRRQVRDKARVQTRHRERRNPPRAPLFEEAARRPRAKGRGGQRSRQGAGAGVMAQAGLRDRACQRAGGAGQREANARGSQWCAVQRGACGGAQGRTILICEARARDWRWAGGSGGYGSILHGRDSIRGAAGWGRRSGFENGHARGEQSPLSAVFRGKGGARKRDPTCERARSGPRRTRAGKRGMGWVRRRTRSSSVGRSRTVCSFSLTLSPVRCRAVQPSAFSSA